MSQTIGILGGGQLGRMLTEAAIKLGFKVWVVDPTPNCPAKQAGAEQILADYKDSAALRKLASKSDYLTIEFEHLDAKALAEVAKNKPVNPSPDTISLIQDKYEQKKFLADDNFPTADFVELKDAQQAASIYNKWGAMLIKSKTEAFDGRGNSLITDKSQIAPALEQYSDNGVYGERLVDFKMELAVMVAKDINGNMLSFPVVQTVHKRSICTETYCPAEIEPKIAELAKQTAETVVAKLEGAGIYGVEMFLTKNNEILINEIAPRVHNSGHYTMDMFDVSQFEQHILAIAGGRLKTPILKAEACCMINILGQRDGPVELSGVAEAENIPGVKVYIYGKKPTKVDRKMGHINATAGTIKEAIDKARQARELISI